MSHTYIGLACTFHDPAIAIVSQDGEVIFAEGTERPLQDKRAFNAQADLLHRLPELLEAHTDTAGRFTIATSWSRWFRAAIAADRLLSEIGLDVLRARYTAPLTDRQRTLMRLHWNVKMQHRAMSGIGENLRFVLRDRFDNDQVTIRHLPHHDTHAAFAALASPFERAAVLTVDGFGEGGSVSAAAYDDQRLTALCRDWGRGSLGFYYARLTEWCGFDPLKGEEWKVMGLAPYGSHDPAAYALLRTLLAVRGVGLRAAPARAQRSAMAALAQRGRAMGPRPRDRVDLAFTGQQVFEEWMTTLLVNLHERHPVDDLVLTGGCALNSAYNGQIAQRTPFSRVFVPPAPADDGNAIGAALLAWRADHPTRRRPTRFFSPYQGSGISPAALSRLEAFHPNLRHLPDTLCAEAARLLAAGKILGIVQGRAEFGPRALGNRSIVADPRRADMKERINAQVKFREAFRPFAPSILDEHGPEWFEDYQSAPYMERTLVWRESVRQQVPAVVHANGTGRLQSVRREWNPRYHDLIQAFFELTGVPIVLNTSLNVMGRPVVHSLEDAVSVFYTTGLDALIIGDYLLEKPA
jgi:carbamoyltransferase